MAQKTIPAELGNGDFYQIAFHAPTLCLPLCWTPDMEVLGGKPGILETHYGLTRDQVVGKRCFKVFHQSGTSPAAKTVAPSMRPSRVPATATTYHEYTTPDGDSAGGGSVAHPAGGCRPAEIWGVMESMRDVSRGQVRLKRDMAEANELLNRILDSLVGVVVAVGSKRRTYLFVNRSAKRVLGYDQDELVGRAAPGALRPGGNPPHARCPGGQPRPGPFRAHQGLHQGRRGNPGAGMNCLLCLPG